MNTPKQGTYRWMIYKEGDSWIGVVMEFNIVVTGEDPRMVEIELNEAVIGYLESWQGSRAAQKHGAPSA